MNIIEEIKKLEIGIVEEEVNLKKITTYKIDEKALGIVYPNDIDALIKLLKFLNEEGIKYRILGNGSNVIFKNYYNGILIKLSNLNNLEIKDDLIIVGAGYSTTKLSYKAAELGLSGLEFAAGIPGTVGGALYMNAGAYKSDMGYLVLSAKILTPNLEIKTFTNKELDFHYRTSFLMKNSGYICLEATLKLEKKNKDEILEIMNDRKRRRTESQPLEFPSAGSVFRNPENDFAGRLVEAVGYKGVNKNGATVSEKHANFIINMGSATGKDIVDLIEEIKQKVKDEYGVELKVEQEIIE